MLGTLKQLLILIKKTDKIWFIPIILFLIIVALLAIGAQIAPIPIFVYPIL